MEAATEPAHYSHSERSTWMQQVYAELWKTLATTGRWQGEIWNQRKNGELFLEWLSISTVYAEDGAVARYIGIFSDITDRKAAEERVAHLAQYDVLTNLPNRSLLIDRLAQALKTADRNGHRVGCIFVDLDHFKAINDSLGHDVGDVLLQTVAQRLSATVRTEDTVARMGGDEFVIVLPELHDGRHAATVAHKLLEALVPSLYLRRFPIDKIKIDRSFVHEIAEDADAASIVSGIIGLGKSLKLRVVAEGVETERQLELLRERGCDEAQGYLYSAARPAAEFAAFAAACRTID